MSKKTLIFCIVVVAVLLIGAATAVYFLYADQEKPIDTEARLGDRCDGFFQVVPADAVAVFRFDSPKLADAVLSAREPLIPMLPDGKFRDFLSSVGRSGLQDSQVIISYHYVGGLEPLLVVDLCKSSQETPSQATALLSQATEAGLSGMIIDCSSSALGGTYLKGRKILVVSTSDVVAESSQRHIDKGISVLDKEYFQQAVASMHGVASCLFISNENVGKLVDTILNREYRAYTDALKRFANWSAYAIEDAGNGLRMSGLQFCGSGADKFMNVFEGTSPATSTAFSVLPSYAVTVFSMPMASQEDIAAAYEEYFASKSGRAKYTSESARLKSAAGMSPTAWATALDLKEVAVASFYTGDNLENVLLLKVGNEGSLQNVFEGLDPKAAPVAADYKYSGFAASLYGKLFSAKDETKYAYVGGWIVAGSPAGVDEYVSGRALETTLSAFVAGAGIVPEVKNINFLGYYSTTEDDRMVDRVFRPKYAAQIKEAADSAVYVPVLFTTTVAKGHKRMALSLDKVKTVTENAPEIERDTSVEVPKGPFEVMNSGTGKMNTFYQQENMFICLNDENGKGLWGAPFKTPLCGRAGTVDYFANGKLQILFASGTKLYLIDRLGRFVSPFPVELGKEVLLGPDIYDFNNQKKYNVMILHTDNTIDMYNLQGKKPAEWKGITASETIKNLPERIRVDGKGYWVVRTSLQTLVFPFYGGDPVYTLKGNDKIRPDSRITPVAGGVKAANYSGKEVTISFNK